MVLIVSTALLKDISGKQTEAFIQEVSRHQRYSLLAPCPFLLNREHDLVGRIGRNILATDNFVPSVHACSDNIATLLALCAMGKGACISPKNLAFSILSKAGYTPCLYARGRSAVPDQICVAGTEL